MGGFGGAPIGCEEMRDAGLCVSWACHSASAREEDGLLFCDCRGENPGGRDMVRPRMEGGRWVDGGGGKIGLVGNLSWGLNRGCRWGRSGC